MVEAFLKSKFQMPAKCQPGKQTFVEVTVRLVMLALFCTLSYPPGTILRRELQRLILYISTMCHPPFQMLDIRKKDKRQKKVLSSLSRPHYLVREIDVKETNKCIIKSVMSGSKESSEEK